MYDLEPEQQGADPYSLEVLRQSFELGGWWGKARDNQRYTKGLNESLVFVDWDYELGHPTFETVTSDLVTIDHAQSNASRPVTVWRARRRIAPDGRSEAWFWDRWSVAGGVGSYTVWTSDRKRDVTSSYFDPGMWRDERYRYRDEAGRPILPCVLYHARGGSSIWAPHARSEVVFGTLQVGVAWTAANHGLLRASWNQRAVLNGKVRGGTVVEAGNAAIRTVTPDPTSILQIDGENASIAEWTSPLDLEKAEGFCRRYEARLAVHFGLSPADIKIESVNPSSGAAITVSRRGLREIALRDRVYFGKGDRQLAEVVASVNRGWGVPCSARGYRLRYRGIELTPTERKEVIEYVEKELELGLLDRVSAYQELHPGTSAEDAEADLRLQDIRRRQEEVLAALAEPTSPTV